MTAGRQDGGTADVLHVRMPGADLLLQHKPGVPLVSLGLYQRRHTSETAEDAGLGMLAVRSAVRGAGEHDAGELALAFERLGGVLGLSAGSEWFGFTTSVLSRFGLDAVALLDLVFRFPRLDPAEVDQERRTLLDSVLQNADDMSRYPVELAFRARFGPTGYGLPVAGIPESLRGLTANQVQRWQQSVVGAPARRPVLVAAGDLEPQGFGEAAARIFESCPARVEDWTPVATAPATVNAPVLVEERNKRQTALAILFPGPTRSSPERFSAEVWSAMASGLGGRLFVALRDRLSLAYVVRASVWQRRGAGAILAYLATSPEREDEARRAMQAELARFRDELPDDDELGRAIRFLSGQALIGRQTAGGVAAELAEAWLSLGEAGLEEVADPLAGIRQVSRESIRRFAAASFGDDQAVLGIVRGVAEATMFRSHG